MSRKLKIYLDTSVPNAYMDLNKLERQVETKEFWGRLEQYQVFVSEWVIKEIQKTPGKNKRDELMKLIKEFGILQGGNEEIQELTQN